MIRCPTPPSADKVSFQERGRWRNPSRRPADVSHRARVSPDDAHEIACARVKAVAECLQRARREGPIRCKHTGGIAEGPFQGTSCPRRRPCQVHSILREGTKARIGGQEGVGGCVGRHPRRRGAVSALAGRLPRMSTVTGTSTSVELESLRGLVAELTQGNSERMFARVVHSEAVQDIHGNWRLSAKSETRCRRHCRPTTMPKGSKPAHWPLLQSTWSL